MLAVHGEKRPKQQEERKEFINPPRALRSACSQKLHTGDCVADATFRFLSMSLSEGESGLSFHPTSWHFICTVWVLGAEREWERDIERERPREYSASACTDRSRYWKSESLFIMQKIHFLPSVMLYSLSFDCECAAVSYQRGFIILVFSQVCSREDTPYEVSMERQDCCRNALQMPSSLSNGNIIRIQVLA